MPVTVIANARNRGFPAAINQGLQVARGEYLVLLNNDAVVTDGWLDQLIALVNAKIISPRRRESRDGDRRARAESDDHRLQEARADDRRQLDGERPLPSTPPGPPFARGGEFDPSVSLHCRDAAWTGSGRLNDRPGRADVQLCRAAAVGRGACRIATWTRCTPSPGGGATSTAGKWFTVPKLSGFCLLMKRAVYDADRRARRAVRPGVLRRRRPGRAGAAGRVRAGRGP